MAIVDVTFEWDDARGRCYDCGRPAGYVVAELYWNRTERPDSPPPVDAFNLFCAVCAAGHATDGHRIYRLWWEDEGYVNDEHERLISELGFALADEFVENGLDDVAEYLREHGVAATRKWIDSRIAEAKSDPIEGDPEGWILGNLEVARDKLFAQETT